MSTSRFAGNARLLTPPSGMEWAPKDRTIRERADTDMDMESGGKDTTRSLTAKRVTISAEPVEAVRIKKEPSPDDVPMYLSEPPRDSAHCTPSTSRAHSRPTHAIQLAPAPHAIHPPPVSEPTRVLAMHGVDMFHLCTSKQLPRPLKENEVRRLNDMQERSNNIFGGRGDKLDMLSYMPAELKRYLSNKERGMILAVQNRIKAANEQ
jgi:hypothetical protein